MVKPEWKIGPYDTVNAYRNIADMAIRRAADKFQKSEDQAAVALREFAKELYDTAAQIEQLEKERDDGGK